MSIGILKANMLLYFILWIGHNSIRNVGGLFYSFGWEMMLNENGFLAIIMSPLLKMDYNQD